METWFAKSVIATAAIVPTFIAIPIFKFRYGIDPLVFLVWYFAATSASIAVYWVASGRAGTLVPAVSPLAIIIAIGLLFGALANGSLFQAIGLAPNPGLPPVIYATSSMVVFLLSVFLASSIPALLRPVTADMGRFAGMVLVIVGLYLLAGGRIGLTRGMAG